VKDIMLPTNNIDGDQQDNVLHGGPRPDLINGWGGNDALYGDDGDDTLDGGAGSDTLDGGRGSNTFRFGYGDGLDKIEAGFTMDAGRNVLLLDADVAPQALRLSQVGPDLMVHLDGGPDMIMVRGFFERVGIPGASVWRAPLGEIRFADGTRWDTAAIQARLTLADATLLVLGGADDTAHGLALDGGGGDDRLDADGAALLVGGAGNDTLHGSAHADVLQGGSGDDVLEGGAGNDVLDGGAGNDLLDGGGGYDRVRFGHDSGQDSIAAAPMGADAALLIDMAAGVQAATLRFLRAGAGGADLLIELPLSGAQLTVKDYFSTARAVALQFADGSVLDNDMVGQRAAGAHAPASVSGGAGSDVLHAPAPGGIVRGEGGDDLVYGGAGDDLLSGSEGNDLLDGRAGNDVVDGGAGDDHIVASAGDEARPSATIVLFGRASGHDLLDAPRANATLTVLLEAGIAPGDIGFERLGGGMGRDLLIVVGERQASIRVPDFFEPLPALALRFADGTVWDAGLIASLPRIGGEGRDDLLGSAGADYLDGRGGDDVLVGLDGNDLLRGGAGRDSLYGDQGDDTLDGGQGDDYLDDQFGNTTYIVARGDGHDLISNRFYSPDVRYQTLQLQGGIAPEQLRLHLVSRGVWDDLVLTVDGEPGQSITLQGMYCNDPAAATNMELLGIRFGDGSAWDRAAIVQRLGMGTPYADYLGGSDGNDLLEGKDGNDQLLGRAGQDTLDGGRGDDQLDGGAGSDTYLFALGDGRDVLSDGQGFNLIRFGAGIAPQDLRLTQRGDALEIAYGSGADVIVLADTPPSVPAGSSSIGQLAFADGSTRTIANYFNHAPVVAKPLPDMAAARGQLFKQSLWYTFSDPDAQDTLTLTVRQANGQPLPEWLVYDARETTLVGYAPMSPSAVYQLRVTATDRGGLQVSDDFSLTLDAPNMAPYVTSSGANAHTAENTYVNVYLPTFADVDVGDSLSVKVSMADGSALPGWMSYSGQHFVGARPGYAHAGTYVLSATATDKGGLSVSRNVELVVADVNRAPLPTQAPGTLEAAQGTPFAGVLPAKAFVDPDGDALVYQVSQADGSALPAWLVFDPLGRSLSGTPPAGAAPVLNLLLKATDSAGLSSSSGFTLNVAADAPLLLSGTADADVLDGRSAGDLLNGLGGNDQLNGGAGNDVLDGGAGLDRMSGGAGDDRYLVDAAGDVVLELANGGRDTVLASVSYTLSPHVEVLVLGGNLALAGYGNSGDNILSGNGNNNFLAGNGGNDILQGGAGNDSLVDNGGNNLFDGGSGNDSLSGAAGNEMFIGAAGNDVLTPGGGIDIIAFNRGDGSDTLNPGAGLDNVISLGRGIAYADLSLQKVGTDLVLGTGAGEQINLKGWYAAPANHSVGTLQIFIDAGADYQPASGGGSIHQQKIQQFNFDTLAGKFDQALLADPAVGAWKLAPVLGAAWTGSGESAAAGADLAQQYASSGSLANLAQVPALALIGSAAFGVLNQPLAAAPLALADGSAFLM
jgi:Ca2+-binding RTX toxin-like protein